MKELNIFLRALEQELNFKEKFFICKKNTVPNSKFPAYKDIDVEVWCVDHNDKNKLISKVHVTTKETTEIEAKHNNEYLLKETYKNLLSFYGI